MRPLFTIHAGEYLVGLHVQKFLKLNAWIPAKDIGIDLLVTDSHNLRAVSLQVKYGKDFLPEMKAEMRKSLRCFSWFALNMAKLKESTAEFWVFVLHGFKSDAPDFIVIPTAELQRRMTGFHGSDSFAVITQKSQPTVGRFWIPGRSSHPAGDGCLRYIQSEHQEFAMDSRCTPGRILRHHPEDQRTGLLGDPPTTADSFSCFAEHRPIQFEPGSMPAHDRVR
jgi:hypothetical protein